MLASQVDAFEDFQRPQKVVEKKYGAEETNNEEKRKEFEENVGGDKADKEKGGG